MAGRHDTVVIKIGTSSITDDDGVIDRASVGRLCDGVAALRSSGRRVVVVTAGAIAAGANNFSSKPLALRNVLEKGDLCNACDVRGELDVVVLKTAESAAPGILRLGLIEKGLAE